MKSKYDLRLFFAVVSEGDGSTELDWKYGKRGVVFPYHSLAQKKDSTSNRSRNLCFMIKTVHAGIDGLLRILFVEHLPC